MNRASVDPTDPGYANWVKNRPLVCYLDGAPVRGVITACEVEGFVERYVYDADGRYVRNASKTQILRERLFGQVCIERST